MCIHVLWGARVFIVNLDKELNDDPADGTEDFKQLESKFDKLKKRLDLLEENNTPTNVPAPSNQGEFKLLHSMLPRYPFTRAMGNAWRLAAAFMSAHRRDTLLMLCRGSLLRALGESTVLGENTGTPSHTRQNTARRQSGNQVGPADESP